MSFFNSVTHHPEDPILGMEVAFKADTRPEKVNLGVGAYKTAEGTPQVFSSVRKAEKLLLEKNLDKEYLPILGNAHYIKESEKLLFGEDSPILSTNKICSAQSLGGTGALRCGGELLFQNNISKNIYLPDPTWSNHWNIFAKAGMKISAYNYYDKTLHTLNFSGMKKSIENMPAQSVILLQPCCHNPTGITPSLEQWKELSILIKNRKILPFFDLAYQGFDQGLDEDAEVVRHFVKSGHEMLVALSYSKNFGLYGERTGLLSVINQDETTSESIRSQLKHIIRSNYSNPPLQGQRIITTILQSKELKEEWVQELHSIRERIHKMRKELLCGLTQKTEPNRFQFLTNQTGMFSFSGLNKAQVHKLEKNHGIYMQANGRINIAGLNSKNIHYVIESILAVI